MRSLGGDPVTGDGTMRRCGVRSRPTRITSVVLLTLVSAAGCSDGSPLDDLDSQLKFRIDTADSFHRLESPEERIVGEIGDGAAERIHALARDGRFRAFESQRWRWGEVLLLTKGMHSEGWVIALDDDPPAIWDRGYDGVWTSYECIDRADELRAIVAEIRASHPLPPDVGRRLPPPR